MNKKDTLYWAVYKNLEREIIELSWQIHFHDKQTKVYSVKIAELLVRSSIEIESIAKELYYKNEGSVPIDDDGNVLDLYFDTDCLQHLEDRWKLSKKKVLVSASTFYFENEDNLILTPLKKANKRGLSGADWKRAYQSVKHDRSKMLSKGNIKHLIRAMAALYLLNLYYRDEIFYLGTTMHAETFDDSLGSEIFSIVAFGSPAIRFDNTTGEVSEDELGDECVYYKKYKNDDIKKIVLAGRNWIAERDKVLFKSPEYQAYMKDNPSYFIGKKSIGDIENVCIKIGRSDLISRTRQIQVSVMESLFQGLSKEAVLNKNARKFPEIEGA